MEVRPHERHIMTVGVQRRLQRQFVSREREPRPRVFHLIVAPRRRIVAVAARPMHGAAMRVEDAFACAQLAHFVFGVDFRNARMQIQRSLQFRHTGLPP